MKTSSNITSIKSFGTNGMGTTNSAGQSNTNPDSTDNNAPNDVKKRNDPNRVDPTKQDERDNDPTRIRPEINEPDKNDPTNPPEPGKLPQPGSENDKKEQPKKTIGFLREEE